MQISNFYSTQIVNMNKTGSKPKTDFVSCSNLSPLQKDTVSFTGRGKNPEEIIEMIKKGKMKINGNYNFSRKDLVKLYEYFGWRATGVFNGDDEILCSPYQSGVLLNIGRHADPNAVASVMRGIKNLDKTNGELLYSDSTSDFQNKLSDFIVKTKDKKQGFKYKGVSYSTKNSYRDIMEAADKAAQVTVKKKK